MTPHIFIGSLGAQSHALLPFTTVPVCLLGYHISTSDEWNVVVNSRYCTRKNQKQKSHKLETCTWNTIFQVSELHFDAGMSIWHWNTLLMLVHCAARYRLDLCVDHVRQTASRKVRRSKTAIKGSGGICTCRLLKTLPQISCRFRTARDRCMCVTVVLLFSVSRSKLAVTTHQFTAEELRNHHLSWHLLQGNRWLNQYVYRVKNKFKKSARFCPSITAEHCSMFLKVGISVATIQ